MTETPSHSAPRRRLALLVAVVVALLLPATASGYGWPVKPFGQQHPVRGFFGDPRIGPKSHSLHFGIDIVAPDGAPVYATQNGIVWIEPTHRNTVVVRGDTGRIFSYWHVIPTVRTGARVVAYRTVIGHVEAPWAHVHFVERREGRYLNPLRPGALQPFADGTRPEAGSLTAERAGAPLPVARLAGRIALVAEVRDWMP
ncbi:MAG: M23 family metallopeptidase, partial [Pseudomonadota bacterium]